MRRFFVLHICFVIFAYLSLVQSVSVDRVYFESETIWAVNEPRVICDVTEDVDEIVEEIQWHRFDELVYRWAIGERIQVYGVLIDNVEIPSNDTDWNIMINRLKKTMEGNFTCTAITDKNTTSTSEIFDFIVFYSANKTTEEYTDEQLCLTGASFNYTSVYPKPLAVICEMESNYNMSLIRLNGTETASLNKDGSYKYHYQILPVQFNQYKKDSEMICYHYVYGSSVTNIQWKTKELPSCSDPENFSGYKMNISEATPGCRGGYKIESRISFICEINKIRNKELECDKFGNWKSMSGSEWNECSKASFNAFVPWIMVFTFGFLKTSY